MLFGVVKDAINGMPIDSVAISVGGAKFYSNAKGVFKLQLNKKNTKAGELVLTKNNFETLKLAIPYNPLICKFR